MKNWKKVMAMLCTAAMVTGFSAPVWAEADAAEDTETADDEITELTMDMLDEAAYEGTWLSFEQASISMYQVTGMFWKFQMKMQQTVLCSRHRIQILKKA